MKKIAETIMQDGRFGTALLADPRYARDPSRKSAKAAKEPDKLGELIREQKRRGRGQNEDV